jgi:hypothetical protein
MLHNVPKREQGPQKKNLKLQQGSQKILKEKEQRAQEKRGTQK